jgi:hypothetical protein
MPIKSNLEKHTVSWLRSQDAAGKLNKNISIQRKEVWNAEKKSNLIVSLLLDIPIESLLFEESEKKSHNVLDGKQRVLALCAFVADEFALSPKIRVREIDGTPLAGLKFSMLPEELQTRVTEYELSISILRPLGGEDRATVFFMRNQAVALSKMDLSLVMLGEAAMDTFSALCSHPFIAEKIKLTAPAVRKHDDLRILLQYLIVRAKPDMGFSGTEIMGLCDDIKNGEAEIPAEDLAALLDYLNEALPKRRKYLKKAHVPIVLRTAQTAKDSGMPAEEFGLRLEQFFCDEAANSKYMELCQSGSAKRANIKERIALMGRLLEGEAPEMHEPQPEAPKPEPEPEPKRRGRRKKLA